MASDALLFKIDAERVAESLEQARESKSPESLELDFSAVRRLDVNAVQALEQLIQAAEGRSVRLRGVDVEVYKVLKLMRLSSRLSFVA